MAWCAAAPSTSGLNHQVAHATGGPTPQHQGRCKGTCPLDSGFKRARRAWAIQVFFAGGGAACGPLCKGADFLWVVGLNHLMAHANRKMESNPPPTPSARPRGQLKLGFGANLAAATWRPPQPLPTVTPHAPTVAGVKPPGGPVPPLSDPCDPRAATAPVGSGFWHGAFWGCAAAPPRTQVCRFYLNHAKRWPSDPARPVDFWLNHLEAQSGP